VERLRLGEGQLLAQDSQQVSEGSQLSQVFCKQALHLSSLSFWWLDLLGPGLGSSLSGPLGAAPKSP
jgi:hypothetical protein